MELLHQIWNLWFRFPQKIRFLLVGGFNTVVSYLMFLGFVWFLSPQRYQTALFMSWLLSSLISYTTQKIFVWQTVGGCFREYCRCLLTWSFAYLINAALLWILVEKTALPVWLAQATAICTVTVFTFILFKYFAFARKTHEKV